MVLNSFAELGEVFGVKQRPRKQRVYHCKRCGCEMYRVGETNVYLCPGKNDKNEPCMNRMILPVFAH